MFKTEEALAIIGGHVDEELLLCNEYLAIENIPLLLWVCWLVYC